MKIPKKSLRTNDWTMILRHGILEAYIQPQWTSTGIDDDDDENRL